jgi:4-hydroxy-tetrahydrodipicolinate synthase
MASDPKKAACSVPHGLWPVMLTPFKEDGAIDWNGLDALTDWYLAEGAAGLFACCLSSEMYALDPAERLELVRAVVKRTAGRVPVVATGTFGGPLKDQAEFIRRMAEAGAAAAVVTPCQLVGPEATGEAVRERLEELLRLTDPLPLGIYECPLPYKRVVSPELAGWAGRTGRFTYFKDTCGDAALIAAKLAAARHTPLGLFNAHVMTALTALRAGAAGVSPVAGNCYPFLFAWLCRHWQDRPAEAERLAQQLSALDAQACCRYFLGGKLYLQLLGLPISTRCREKAPRLQPGDHELFESVRQAADRLREQLR